MKYLKKFITLFIIPMIVLYSFPLIDVTASTTFTQKVVKVGIPNSAYFSERQEDGTYTGIVIDYLQEISKYAGWSPQYIEGTSDELIKKLELGEIDIVGGMLKNEYTLSKFDFSDYNSGYSYTTLVVPKDSDKYVPMDYSSFNGMRVGIFTKSTNRIHAFNTFLESNNLDIVPIYYEDGQSLIDAPAKGEVDAILSNDTSLRENDMIIAKFSAIPYYFAVTKGNSAVLQDLNTAHSIILEVNPKFDDMIYEKYFTSTNGKLILNNNEKLFIETCPPLKVAIVSTLAPLEYYNKSKDKAEGIIPNILELISSRTGLNFVFHPVDSLETAEELLLRGEVDLLTGLDVNYSENTTGIVFTKQFLNTQKVIIKNSSPKKGGKNVFAQLKGYSQVKEINSTKTNTFDTADACIQAVISGKAEYTSMNNLVVDYYTYLRGNSRISITPITNASNGLRFGLARPANPNLLSIIDKTIYSIDIDDIQGIVYENTTTDNVAFNLTSFLYTYPFTFTVIFCSILAILLCAIVLMSLYIRTKLRLSQQIAVRGDSYRIISELTNEYIVNFDYDTGIMTLPSTFATLTGHKITYTVHEITTGTSETIKALYSTFADPKNESKVSIEFMCPLTNNETDWFKAVSTVIFNYDKKPIKGIGRITSIQNEKEEKERLEARANTDVLTQLYNRQYLEYKILEYFEQFSDLGHGALMLIDLDYFKTINDTLGHLAGDQVLKEFAQTLFEEFHEVGIVGRWGGDEFIVFIQNAPDKNQISEQAKHLCQIVNREFHYEGKVHLLSISIGIALTHSISSYSELFQNADSALYDVKNATRNGFKIYGQEF